MLLLAITSTPLDSMAGCVFQRRSCLYVCPIPHALFTMGLTLLHQERRSIFPPLESWCDCPNQCSIGSSCRSDAIWPLRTYRKDIPSIWFFLSGCLPLESTYHDLGKPRPHGEAMCGCPNPQPHLYLQPEVSRPLANMAEAERPRTYTQNRPKQYHLLYVFFF